MTPVGGWRGWFRPPRRLEVTREGKVFIGITFGVGFAAINTGNNLLYLLLGMMLSLIIASGVLSEMVLRDLRITRQLPGRIHVGQPVLVSLTLANKKRRLPTFSIEAQDRYAGQPVDKKCYFLKVSAGREQVSSYRLTFARRGRHQFSGLRISTRFPFGLFAKSRLLDARSEVVVFPALSSIAQPAPPKARAYGAEARGAVGRRGEFHGLHEFRQGDDPRDIHWRSSARRGRLMVREYEDESSRRVTVFLDHALAGGASSTDSAAKEALERAISLCASLAADYLDRGYAVRLITRTEVVNWLYGPAQLLRLLHVLALVEPVSEGVPFAAAPEATVEPILVTRKGARQPRFGRVLEC